MESADAITYVAAGVLIVALFVYVMYELLVRAFGAYACSEDPRGAELLAQLAFFVHQLGIAPRHSGQPGLGYA